MDNWNAVYMHMWEKKKKNGSMLFIMHTLLTYWLCDLWEHIHSAGWQTDIQGSRFIQKWQSKYEV